MVTALIALLSVVRDIVRRRTDLEAELLALRHQVLVLQRQHGRRRVQLRPADRVYWVVLSRLWPRWRKGVLLVKPETVEFWRGTGTAVRGKQTTKV
jgi:putative transposase